MFNYQTGGYLRPASYQALCALFGVVCPSLSEELDGE